MWSVSNKPGDKLTISAKTGYYSGKTYSSRIGDVLDEHLLLIDIPISRGSYVRLPEGEVCSLLFYTEDGLFQTNGKILGYCVENNVELIRIEIDEYQRIQRRNFYRVNMISDFTFTRAEDLLEGELNDDIPIYKGVIKDISGGGLCFKSDIVMVLNEAITCNLTLSSEKMTVEGRVRGINLLENFDNKYVYRIEFVNIENSMREQIIQYVFYIQREMIKRMKQKL